MNKIFYKSYERFIKIRGNPHQIAMGVSLGVFIGVLPIGLQAISAIFIASLLKWNKISAALGTLITNPLTFPFIYSITYWTGKKMMLISNNYQIPENINTNDILSLLHKAPHIFLTLIVGGLCIGLPASVITYYFSYKAILKYRNKKKQSSPEKTKNITKIKTKK